MQIQVYSVDGVLLTPTTNSRARRLLSQKRARIKSHKPFSIQLITQNQNNKQEEEEVRMDHNYTTTRELGIENLARYREAFSAVARSRQKGYTTSLIGMAFQNKNIHIIVGNKGEQSRLVELFSMLEGRIHTPSEIETFMRGRSDDIIFMWDNSMFNYLNYIVSQIVDSKDIVGYAPFSEKPEMEMSVPSDIDAKEELRRSMVTLLTPMNLVRFILIRQYSVLEKMVEYFPEEVSKMLDSGVTGAIEQANDIKIYKIFLNVIGSKNSPK